jgi:cyclomaltodextrin glucanotransferase
MSRVETRLLYAVAILALSGCAAASPKGESPADYYGTLHPFAAEAVYFVVTDRFVNGDTSNDYRDQGGANHSFDRPMTCADGVVDNVGYLGGDFRGLLDNADYIRDMGFSSVWITPIVDNPGEAFTGGDAITCTSILTDRGKAAYHGYWGTNFYKVDEHLPSAGLGFADLTRELRGKGLKTVLDIVANHGSPAYGMTMPQADFGRIYAADGSLLADHQNLAPDQLDPEHQPLHRFFNKEGNLAQLADLNGSNPEVMDYLVNAYLQWIEQGAYAFRVDTVPYQSHEFWKEFTTRIRARHPDFFMFGEVFKFDARELAPYTWAENGAMSVLDFPLKAAMAEVFPTPDSDYSKVEDALYLTKRLYQNPYELATFYDNHDMARMQASDAGFIDAHNWLFTARGIPVIYYGSEMGFMRGRVEHSGNRNYYGVDNIAAAKASPIRAQLARIAKVRAASPALQRGLQLNLEFDGNRAAFLRVYQHEGTAQTALVLLNKGDAAAEFSLSNLPTGRWRNALGDDAMVISSKHHQRLDVAAHDVSVWLLDTPIAEPRWNSRLSRLMRRTLRK